MLSRKEIEKRLMCRDYPSGYPHLEPNPNEFEALETANHLYARNDEAWRLVNSVFRWLPVVGLCDMGLRAWMDAARIWLQGGK